MVFFIFSSVFLLHFSPFKPLSYPLTLAPFAALYLIFTFVNVSKIKIKLAIFIFIVPLWVIIKSTFELFSGDVELIEFIKTFILWLFYFFCVVFCFGELRPQSQQLVVKIKTASSSLVIALFIFVIMQVIYFKMTNDITVFSFWGDFGYASNDYLLRAIEFGAGKSNGPYLEPAMLGLVSFTLFVILIILNGSVFFWIPVFGITLLSGSASAIVGIIFTVIILAFKKQNANSKWDSMVRVGILITGGILIFILGPYLLIRFNGVYIEGSSTYYRFVAPLQVLSDILIHKPFGATFGTMEKILLRYGMLNGVTAGKTLDNGWYLLIFFFGWPGLILFISSIYGAIVAGIKGNQYLAVTVGFFMLSPLFTGAVFSPEFLLLQMLVLFSYRLKYKIEQ